MAEGFYLCRNLPRAAGVLGGAGMRAGRCWLQGQPAARHKSNPAPAPAKLSPTIQGQHNLEMATGDRPAHTPPVLSTSHAYAQAGSASHIHQLGLKKALEILQGLTEHRRDAACSKGQECQKISATEVSAEGSCRDCITPVISAWGNPSLLEAWTQLHFHTAPHPRPAESNEGTRS